jgi:hypothetical protein
MTHEWKPTEEMSLRVAGRQHLLNLGYSAAKVEEFNRMRREAERAESLQGAYNRELRMKQVADKRGLVRLIIDPRDSSRDQLISRKDALAGWLDGKYDQDITNGCYTLARKD